MALTQPSGGAPLSKSGRWSGLWAGGMLLMFVGERMIGSGKSRGVATIAGLLAVLAAMVIRFVRSRQTTSDRRYVERVLLGLYALALGAVVLYVVQSDLWTSAFGKPLEKNWPKLATALAALWPAIWLAICLAFWAQAKPRPLLWAPSSAAASSWFRGR